MTKHEIINEIIRLGNLLLREEEAKKENAVEDDYENDSKDYQEINQIYPNQCKSTSSGNHCHKLLGHFGPHHNILTGCKWGTDGS